MREVFPDFSASPFWYSTKLLKSGTVLTKQITYKIHLEGVNAALNAAGLKTHAKTHVGRGSRARIAELGGASEAQIRRLGRWNNQAMENCYLTALPREALRTG